MHILYIHQYFATLRGNTGTRSYEFARRWVSAGHSVTMLTTTAQLTGEDLKGCRGFTRKFSVEGINVTALNIRYKQQMGFLSRVYAFLAFLIAASVKVLFVKNVDVVYATSTPLTVGIPALISKWFRRIPFVFEVRDQWPQVPIGMGVLKNRLLIKCLLWLEKQIYINSGAVVALSPGMAEGVRKVAPADREVIMIPNCADLEMFRSEMQVEQIRRMHGWNDKLVFMHFGAMGRANGLDFLVEVAERFRDEQRARFVLLGDGREKEYLKNLVARKNLGNVDFINSKPKIEMSDYISACDVSTVVFANYPILESNSANKFFDSLSAGKPVLLNYSGWQREIIEKANAGFGCELCNIDEFSERVRYFCEHPQECKEMGRNAKCLAEREFNRDKLAGRALKVIQSIYLRK